MSYEPPILPDDTPPHGSGLYTTLTPDDTHPSRPRRPDANKRPDTRLLVLGVIIGVTAVSLVLTLGLLLLTGDSPDISNITPIATRGPYSITLVNAGKSREVETLAETVEDLLAKENIQLAAEDAISDPPETLLRDGMVITIDRARDIELVIDGERRVFRTPFDNPHDILRSAGLSPDSDDEIVIDGTPAEVSDLLVWPVAVQRIEIDFAVTVTVNDNATKSTLITTADTIGDALYDADISLFLSDTVTPDISEPLTDGMEITIDRAQPITIKADNGTLQTRVQGGTVGDAVSEAGVILTGLDYTIPDEGVRVLAGMNIQVVRVTEEIETEQQLIAYDTVYQPDDTLELDARSTVQVGQSGLMQVNYRVRYENGVEVSREQDSSVVAAEPVNEVIAYGTQVVIRTIDTPDGPREYWRSFGNMVTTSYHPAALGGDNVTAIGMTLTKGIIASDPRIIPYRTEVYVPGYGIGIMADTGGPRSTPYWLDLGYDDENYVPWSRRDGRVYLLTPVPAEIDYLLPGR